MPWSGPIRRAGLALVRERVYGEANSITYLMPDLTSPVGRVRLIGLIEGVSFLLLMGVAMPLKYLAGQPLAVKYVGWAHGLLFVLLCLAILQAWLGGALSFRRSVLAFLASLFPFGPFIIDRHLAADEARGSGV